MNRLRHPCLAFLLALLPLGFAAALPKVAVLQAVAGNRVDRSVTGPVTDRLAEKLVASGKYLVLDRSNVDAVLKEREFQVSGLVSDAEIGEAGRYLGAEYVAVIRVERIGSAWFVSARMIEVETGVIARQSSAEGEGKLQVLLDLAGQAGEALSGTRPASLTAKPSGTPPPSQTTPAPTLPAKSPAAPRPAAAPQAAPVARASADEDRVGLRLYAGYGLGTQTLGATTYAAKALEVYFIVPFHKVLCVLGNFSFLDATAEGGGAATSAELGLGLALPFGALMPWVGAKAGFASLEEGYGGLSLAADLGVDVRFGNLLAGIHYEYQTVGYRSSGGAGLDAESDAVIFMVGFRL